MWSAVDVAATRAIETPQQQTIQLMHLSQTLQLQQMVNFQKVAQYEKLVILKLTLLQGFQIHHMN